MTEPLPIAKTVEMGTPLTFDSTAKITQAYYYKLVYGTGASSYVTADPTTGKQANKYADAVASSMTLTGVKATTSPVTVKLQQSSRQNGTYSDVETYSVTVTKKTEIKNPSTLEMTTADAAKELTVPSAFSQSCSWSATSGDQDVAKVEMVTASGTTPSIKITPQGAGSTTLTVRNSNNTDKYDFSWTVNVTVIQSVTVNVGEPKTIDTRVALGGRYYYKLVADTANYLTLDPATAKRESSGNYTGDLKVTGVKPTTSPVLVRLQTNSRTSDGGTYTDVKTYSVTVTGTPVEAPTAVDGLVYDGTEQTGVAAGTGYTLTGNTATNAGSYTATATLADGYCWSDYTTADKEITWSIARKAATVTVKAAEKLVGTAGEPVYTTTNEGFIDSDATELIWVAWRENTSEAVGTYPVLIGGEQYQGGYDITYVGGTLTIKTGAIVVNGVGYANAADAIAALKANGGTATVYEDSKVGNYAFTTGSTLAYDKATGTLTVTGDLSAEKVAASEALEVNGTLTLNGDIFVGATGADDTVVVATNVVLGANVTVGKESDGATDAIAVLAFEGIDVTDYKLTLTTNGIVRVKEQLPDGGIDAIFTEPTKIKETQSEEDGWWEYTYLPLIPVAVPTAAQGLVYDGNEQTGVVENVGYTLTGNTAKDAGDYTATAMLAAGYIWADGSSDPTNINWTIAAKPVEVTADDQTMLVGGELPELTYEVTDGELVKGDVLVGTLEVDGNVEEVGEYDIIQKDDWVNPNYDITFVKGTLTVRAGKVTVNGKGYDTVEEGYMALVLAAQSGTATAVFNEAVANFNGYSFAKDAALTVADGGVWTVTGDVTAAMIEKEKTVTVVDSTLTLGGDIYVGDRADWPTEVTSSNVVLAANVTVGAATEGFKPVGIATLAFEEINVNGHKLTLTTNGVVQSKAQLAIDDVFAKVDHFGVVEKTITGGYEYTLEATEFSVNYYDGDAVVHTDKATILNYTTDLHIWNGVREGYEFGGYTREDGVTPLLVSDEALRAYVKEEAEKPGCDGEVKVFGTWTEIPKTFDITIEAGEGITNVTMNGESVIGKVTLDAGTTEIALTLMSTNTIPVFKFSKDGGANWAVTNKTPVIAVAANDALKFVSEEAKINDPTVTPEQAKSAIIDAIDDENKEAVAPKVEAVVDTAETPATGKVSAKAMATWITENAIKSVDMKASNYLAASVNLDTSAPITDAADVKFVEVEEDTSTGFTFDFELKLSGKETPEELEVEAAKLASYIQTTGDLGDGFDGGTVRADRVTITEDGKVTITPDPAKSAEFFKIVIPQDPGVK